MDIPLNAEPEEKPPELSSEQMKAGLAAAEETIQRQKAELGRERQRLDQFLSRSPGETPENPPAALGVMPDMIENPDEYRVWHAEKDRRDKQEQTRLFDAEREDRRTEIANAESRANLWQVFQTNHPSHAKLSTLANPAYQRILQRGDTTTDATDLAKAIAAEMDAMAGGSIENFKKAPDRSGGTSGGESPSPKKQKQAEESEGFDSTHKAVSAWQVKYGLQ